MEEQSQEQARTAYSAFRKLAQQSAQELPSSRPAERATEQTEDLPDPFQAPPAPAPLLRLLPHERPGAGVWRLLFRLAFAGAALAAVMPRSLHRFDVPETMPIATGTENVVHVLAEGQLVPYPNALTHVGSDMSGTIARMHVEERAEVRKGDLIAELRADEYRAAVAEARAQIGEAEAEIRLATSSEYRSRRLQEAKLGSDVAVDKAVRDRDTAEAKRRKALASLERREAILAKTRIVAPISGTVISRDVNTGDTIRAGTEVATIVDLQRTRIETEVDEFDVGRIKVGDRVRVTAEGFPGQFWRGQVMEVPDAVVPRRLRPQDPSRLVDSRVLLVKVALLEETPLKLGQRLEVEINYKQDAKNLAKR